MHLFETSNENTTRPIPDELKNKLFVVWAHSGRFNGMALFAAYNKSEAKKMAKNYWLDYGTVDAVQTFEEYCKDMEYDPEEEYASYNVKELGDWEEIEWGT